MLKQIEGSHAMAEAIALCRPEVICAYPITPQTHIVEGLGELVKEGAPGRLRIHQRRKRVRRAFGRDRRLRRRRPRLYRDRVAGPAVHGGGGLQRLRPRPAHRDDAGQPRDRRARSTSGTIIPTPCRCATPDGCNCSPRPTRKRSTCTSRRSGSPRNCRCRSWSASTVSS